MHFLQRNQHLDNGGRRHGDQTAFGLSQLMVIIAGNHQRNIFIADIGRRAVNDLAALGQSFGNILFGYGFSNGKQSDLDLGKIKIC